MKVIFWMPPKTRVHIAPVERLPTIRILLLVAVHKEHMISQFDVEMTRMQGSLKENVFMKFSNGMKYGLLVQKVQY